MAMAWIKMKPKRDACSNFPLPKATNPRLRNSRACHERGLPHSTRARDRRPRIPKRKVRATGHFLTDSARKRLDSVWSFSLDRVINQHCPYEDLANHNNPGNITRNLSIRIESLGG
jgi:hypothetical protein